MTMTRRLSGERRRRNPLLFRRLRFAPGTSTATKRVWRRARRAQTSRPTRRRKPPQNLHSRTSPRASRPVRTQTRRPPPRLPRCRPRRRAARRGLCAPRRARRSRAAAGAGTRLKARARADARAGRTPDWFRLAERRRRRRTSPKKRGARVFQTRRAKATDSSLLRTRLRGECPRRLRPSARSMTTSSAARACAWATRHERIVS
mmetsp:Transcript_13216/g.55505  ORF Transcript_13216/g.55505 Transcript_13216/m.55505 type:complete len:204 (+) Transcript_13216:645-1256(+)